MASVIVRSVCAGVLAAAASTGACGCSPSDDSGEAAAKPIRLPPPQPAFISFVTPALGVPAPGPPQLTAPIVATPIGRPPTVEPAPEAVPEAVREAARIAAPSDIVNLSDHIDEVMVDLDRLVDESLKLQYSLLRLRLRQKPAGPPEPADVPDPDQMPVGL